MRWACRNGERGRQRLGRPGDGARRLLLVGRQLALDRHRRIGGRQAVGRLIVGRGGLGAALRATLSFRSLLLSSILPGAACVLPESLQRGTYYIVVSCTKACFLFRRPQQTRQWLPSLSSPRPPLRPGKISSSPTSGRTARAFSAAAHGTTKHSNARLPPRFSAPLAPSYLHIFLAAA